MCHLRAVQTARASVASLALHVTCARHHWQHVLRPLPAQQQPRESRSSPAAAGSRSPNSSWNSAIVPCDTVNDSSVFCSLIPLSVKGQRSITFSLGDVKGTTMGIQLAATPAGTPPSCAVLYVAQA